MEFLLRSLTIAITGLAALAMPFQSIAQKPELRPHAHNQVTTDAKSAAVYLQDVTVGAARPSRASKGPGSSEIHTTGKRHVASRGAISLYGRERRVGLTFRVYNYSRVPTGTLKNAERRAATILDQSEISARWIDCPTTADEFNDFPDCQYPLSSQDLLMNILPAGMSLKSTLPDDALGLAFVATDESCSRYASLFFDRIQDISRSADVPPELVLGPVIVHEAGHLLLGTNSHSSRGIMQPVWEADNVQALARIAVGFTDPQARLLRQKILGRMRSDACSGIGAQPIPNP